MTLTHMSRGARPQGVRQVRGVFLVAPRAGRVGLRLNVLDLDHLLLGDLGFFSFFFFFFFFCALRLGGGDCTGKDGDVRRFDACVDLTRLDSARLGSLLQPKTGAMPSLGPNRHRHHHHRPTERKKKRGRTRQTNARQDKTSPPHHNRHYGPQCPVCSSKTSRDSPRNTWHAILGSRVHRTQGPRIRT